MNLRSPGYSNKIRCEPTGPENTRISGLRRDLRLGVAWAVILGSLVSLIILGCADESLKTSALRPKTPSSRRTTPIVLNDDLGVQNASFESWKEGVPDHWDLYAGGEAVVLAGEGDAADGLSAVRVKGGGGKDVWLFQNVHANGSLAGTFLELSVDIRSSDPDCAVCVLQFPDGSTVPSRFHSGDDQWQTLSVGFWVPNDLMADRFTVGLGSTNNPTGDTLFDNVHLKLDYALDDLQNGGFEDWSETEPIGWELRDPYHRRFVSSCTSEPQEGKVCLEFTPGYNYTFVRQSVVFADPLAGKILRVKARAKSSDRNSVTIRLEIGKGKKFRSAPHPGDGQWREMEQAYRFPENWDLTSCTVELGAGNDPVHPVYFDDVRITIDQS